MELDTSTGGLLITCYTALGDAERTRDAAQRTLVRAEKAVATHADNGSAMASIFSCLLVLGEAERAKEWARRAVLIDPDNMGMRYNLACDLVVNLQDFELALEMLEPVCLSAGREQLAWLRSDPDMDLIRQEPRFLAMVEQAERRLGLAAS